MHEPIISRELYDHVQEILSLKSHLRRHAFENVLDGCVFCGECGHRMTQATRTNKSGKRYLLRCYNHFAHPEECKRNHAIFYDELIEKVQSDIEAHLDLVGEKETKALTRSLVLQLINYIEIGHAGAEDDSTCRNQVTVHYLESEKEKQKWRNRNSRYFYGW